MATGSKHYELARWDQNALPSGQGVNDSPDVAHFLDSPPRTSEETTWQLLQRS